MLGNYYFYGMVQKEELQVQEAIIAEKIYQIRSRRVMLSGDLAELYQVETKVLNQQVKRNQNRFPERYMFKLSIYSYREAFKVTKCDLKERATLQVSTVRFYRALHINVIKRITK